MLHLQYEGDTTFLEGKTLNEPLVLFSFLVFQKELSWSQKSSGPRIFLLWGNTNHYVTTAPPGKLKVLIQGICQWLYSSFKTPKETQVWKILVSLSVCYTHYCFQLRELKSTDATMPTSGFLLKYSWIWSPFGCNILIDDPSLMTECWTY